jgi:TonB family protein
MPVAKRVMFAILFVGACVNFSAPCFGQQATAPVRVGGPIGAPVKVKDLAPVYPPEAQRAGLSGVVILEAVIGEDGKVRSTRVLRSIPELDQAAIDAVQQWEYTPTMLNGMAVPVIMTVTVNFAMRGAPAGGMSSPPPPPAPNTFRLLSNRGPNGQPLVWDIDLTKAASLPRWNGDGEPPVSTGEAARLARNWLSARNPQGGLLILQNANLVRRPLAPLPPTADDPDAWFYLITYATARIPSPQSLSLPVIVLLDGSVLEPREAGVSP